MCVRPLGGRQRRRRSNSLVAREGQEKRACVAAAGAPCVDGRGVVSGRFRSRGRIWRVFSVFLGRPQRTMRHCVQQVSLAPNRLRQWPSLPRPQQTRCVCEPNTRRQPTPRFRNRRPETTTALTAFRHSPARGEVSRQGEKAGARRQSNRLSDAWCGEQDRLEMAGVIGDTTRDRGRRTEGAAVNYRGLNFRRK